MHFITSKKLLLWNFQFIKVSYWLEQQILSNNYFVLHLSKTMLELLARFWSQSIFSVFLSLFWSCKQHLLVKFSDFSKIHSQLQQLLTIHSWLSTQQNNNNIYLHSNKLKINGIQYNSKNKITTLHNDGTFHQRVNRVH